MTETKAELDNWISDIVAFHKMKCVFLSLKDMESEDADQFLICEFKGYDFKVIGLGVKTKILIVVFTHMGHSLQIGATYSYISEFPNLLGAWEFARRDHINFILTVKNIGETPFNDLREVGCMFGYTAVGGAAQNINERVSSLRPNETRPLTVAGFTMSLEGQAWLRCKLEADENQITEYYLGNTKLGNPYWPQSFVVLNREQLAIVQLLRELKDARK